MVVVLILPSIILFSLAGYLAYIGREGWGWFLFVGLLALSAPASTTNHKPITIDFSHEISSAPSDINP